MDTHIYQGLQNISWECNQCGMPNFSSCIFNSSPFECTNTYEPLSNQIFTDTQLQVKHTDRPASNEGPKVSSDTNITVNKSNTKSVKKVYSKPPKYPCGSCNGAVTWKTAAVCCELCEKRVYKMHNGNVTNVAYQTSPHVYFDTSIVMNTKTCNMDSSINSSFCESNIGSPSAASSPIQKSSKQSYNYTRNKRSDLPLRIIVVNCQSIRNKKCDIDILIETTKPDIMIGNESWLHKDIDSTEVFPQRVHCIQKRRSEPPDLKSDDISEQLCVKVQIIGSLDLYIGSFYKPPNKTEKDYLTHLAKSISRIRQSENCHLWLGGDFNLGGIDWNNYSIKQKAYNTKQCQQLIDICPDNYLEQVVTTPTHYTETSQSMLDLFFTNNSSLVNKTEVIPGISDHEIHIQYISAFLPDAARLGLSATVSLQEEKDIVKALGMKTLCIVKESPDRTNIYREKTLKGSSNDVYEMFENIYKPLCDDLFVKKENYPVTLVYIPIQYMGSAIAYCRFIFRDSNLHNCLYGALCSGQDEKVKATILTDLGKMVPRIRLICCTSAIGMGFNSPSIDCIIHTKPPRNLSDFVQEIGRAGRDGRPARSTLCYNCKRDISNNVPEIKNDIVQYCNDDTCLRSCMLGQFGFEKGDMIDHECCMYCKESCKCIECEILRIEL
ncbi:unnamed protein product [Mytilus coruscus]|uniref:DNA 3'-5' helicase n=1 Tax=Mytilus coruscus TaxID=42192 RepID=A0A6J8EUW9_MYTCO|nr:unnamed protein product [Mytilus coruscus]